MDLNQESQANHVIDHLLDMDVDGETMYYIIEGTNLKYQMLRQLIMGSSDFDINNLLEERSYFNDNRSNVNLK